MDTLQSIKNQATRAEKKRVFDNMNLPARNIIVEHQGCFYERRAWRAGNSFGWGNWKVKNNTF